jgi:long-chain acyl-CoA synthetase
MLADGKAVVLESRATDHVVRPLARRLGVLRIVTRRLEFRDGRATGRVLPAELMDLAAASGPAALLVDDPADPEHRAGSLSVRRALAGRRLLVCGASGFLGKVWLAKVLHDLPEIGEVTLLLRRRGAVGAAERFRELLETSPVFDPLRAFPSDGLARVGERVRVVEGDVARRDLGLDPERRAELAASTDVVISFAGHTDFNPDLRDALAANVEAPLHLLDFVRECRDAALLHVSTCFVAGAREGRVPERSSPFRTPLGQPFDPERERRGLHETVEAFARRARSTSARPRPFRRALIGAGMRRARELGWPNIYTFTKALGEALLVTRGAGVPVAVVRPSIVETSTEFPRRGWAEGANTSAPLSHLLSGPLRHLPVNERKRLDVIPVDAVARGTTLVAAALALRRHDPVYQLATSATNPLDLRRAVELTALAHRRHHRQVRRLKHRLLARLETIPVSRERYRRLSVPSQLRVVRALNRVAAAALGGRRPLARLERALRRVRDLIDLFEPFLLDNEPIFEADRVELLAAALPVEERAAFGYDVAGIDWYDYWVDVHIPALRRWSYPLLEGRRERPDAGDVRLAAHPEPSAAAASSGGA